MAWLRIDDGFTEHRKLIGLKRSERWTWLELLTYCARQQNGGTVPEGVCDILKWVTPAFLNRCVDLGLLDRDDTGAMSVHDWAKYNPRDPLKAERQARWRARVDGTVDAAVDAPVDESNVYTDVYTPSTETVPRVRARVRGPSRPLPPTKEETSSEGVAPDDDELISRLDELKPSATQRARWHQAAFTDPGLVHRQLDAALSNGRNPAAYLDDLITRGTDPNSSTAPPSAHTTTSETPHAHAHRTLTAIITGHGWDDTYTETDIREELERRLRERFPNLDATDLINEGVEDWKHIRDRRYAERETAAPSDDDIPF